MNHVLLVSASPKSPEREEEFNAWFNNYHLQQVLSLPGFVAATRYKISRVQMDWMAPMAVSPEWPYGKHPYLNIYEIEGCADPAAVFEALHSSEPARQSSDPDSDPVTWGPQRFYEAVTEKETSVWLKPVPSKHEGPGSMPLWVVFSSAKPGQEELNHNWYGAQGNLRSPGFQSVIRYELSKTQGRIDSRAPEVSGAWPYDDDVTLAIWELDDPMTAANSRRRGQSAPVQAPGPARFSWMPSINNMRVGGEHIIYEPITHRVTPLLIKSRK